MIILIYKKNEILFYENNGSKLNQIVIKEKNFSKERKITMMILMNN